MDSSIPGDQSDVRLAMVNASGKTGAGAVVAAELAERGFQIVGPPIDPYAADVAEVALLRYGPRAVGDAWLIQSYFDPPVRGEFDAGREDATVEIVLGRAYERVRTPTEVNQAPAGRPTPPGTCASDSTVD